MWLLKLFNLRMMFTELKPGHRERVFHLAKNRNMSNGIRCTIKDDIYL